jgi:general stress protein 26
MSDINNLNDKVAIEKLKELAESIGICLFCTNLKTNDGATCRPMGVQQVCEQGNIWFFSEVNSDKNKEIKEDKQVQLFFAHPGKSSYMVVNGEAEIIMDKKKIEELWTPMVAAWFKDGKDSPNLSIIKVKPTTAYYWDTTGNKMINFFKLLASAATGTNLVGGVEGKLNV